MKRPHITIVNYYDILLPHSNHGGSYVIRGLYKALSKHCDITLITFHEEPDIYHDRVLLSDGFCVVPVSKPESLKNCEKTYYVNTGFSKHNIYDPSLAASRYYADIPELVSVVQIEAEFSRIVITEHPYTYRLLKLALPHKQIWYRAQNVEYDYKKMAWKRCEKYKSLLIEINELEKECCEGSEYVLTITQADADRFKLLYDIPESKLLNISAGVETSIFVLPSNRKMLAPGYKACALFLSSYADASIDALKLTVDLAYKTPQIIYYIIGSVCNALCNINTPDNIVPLGIVSDSEKEHYLSQADFALNLINSGSGMNVKMLEYFAHGLPVITTAFGARGIDIKNKTHCIVTSIENVQKDVLSFCEMDMEERNSLAMNAIMLVKEEYTWDKIANRIINKLLCTHADGTRKESYTIFNDIELSIGNNSQMTHLDTSRNYYIFGAGVMGRKCIDMLISQNIFPAGIVDNNPSLWGSYIDKSPICSLQQFLKKYDAYIIIPVNIFTDFGVHMDSLYRYIDMKQQLLDNNVSYDNIFIAIDGVKLYNGKNRLRDMDMPYYYDYDKIVKNIIDKRLNNKEHII